MTLGQAIDQAFMPVMCDHLEIKSISNSIQVVADAVASVLSVPSEVKLQQENVDLLLHKHFGWSPEGDEITFDSSYAEFDGSDI